METNRERFESDDDTLSRPSAPLPEMDPGELPGFLGAIIGDEDEDTDEDKGSGEDVDCDDEQPSKFNEQAFAHCIYHFEETHPGETAADELGAKVLDEMGEV